LSDAKIAEAKVVKVYERDVWIQSGLCGAKHVMIQHETEGEPFCYCSFNYDHRYTDNASVRSAAEEIAVMLGAEKPVKYK